MSLKVKIMGAFVVSALALSACGNTESTSSESEPKKQDENTEVKQEETKSSEEEKVDYAAVFTEAVDELAKAKEGQEVDYDKVIELYTTNLQELVQKRDEENGETIDQHITTALQAGKDGTMDKVVVKQMVDKLMQKIFFTTMRHEFNEATENWDNKELVKEEVEEAKVFYAILQSTVEKRDAAYGTTMVDAIAGGFSEIDAAIESDDQLAFQLGKQVIDKTLMKTFYFATGAVPNGYATKVANAAKENKEEAVIEQSEGWAFYQALYPYIVKHSEEEGEYIQSQFDLQTDVSTLDPSGINKAFIRGFSNVALHEYEESVETWGEDKSVITALEGALFIDIIGEDIKTLLGEEQYSALKDKAQAYLEAAKAQEKTEADALMADLQSTLNTIIEKAK
ncbi:MAG: hypothetical protein ACQEWV_19315 [Bacillota bacterium]